MKTFVSLIKYTTEKPTHENYLTIYEEDFYPYAGSNYNTAKKNILIYLKKHKNFCVTRGWIDVWKNGYFMGYYTIIKDNKIIKVKFEKFIQ